MSVLVSVALFYTMTDTLLWDLPGDVLAAPASALCDWKGVLSLSLSLSLFLSGMFYYQYKSQSLPGDVMSRLQAQPSIAWNCMTNDKLMCRAAINGGVGYNPSGRPPSASSGKTIIF